MQNTKKRGASAEKGGAMTKRPRLEGQQASGLGSQDPEGEDEEREAERQQKAHGGKGDKLAFKVRQILANSLLAMGILQQGCAVPMNISIIHRLFESRPSDMLLKQVPYQGVAQFQQAVGCSALGVSSLQQEPSYISVELAPGHHVNTKVH